MANFYINPVISLGPVGSACVSSGFVDSATGVSEPDLVPSFSPDNFISCSVKDNFGMPGGSVITPQPRFSPEARLIILDKSVPVVIGPSSETHAIPVHDQDEEVRNQRVKLLEAFITMLKNLSRNER